MLLALTLLAGCGNGDPWVGAFEGTTVTEGRDCATGETFAPDVQDTAVRIERGSRGLFVAGRCPIFLDELSATTVEIVPVTCDYALDDGTPVHVEIVSGRGGLDGDELALDYSAQLDSPDGCITARAEFIGRRQ